MKDNYTVEDLIRLFEIKNDLSGEEYKEILGASDFLGLLEVTGSFYYVITNISKLNYQYVSNSIKQVTGYEASEFMKKGMPFTISLFRSDVAAIQKTIHFEIKKFLDQISLKNKSEYKFTYNNIIKHADGHFVKIMQYNRFLKFNKEGIPLIMFSVVNETTDPNLEHKQVFTISRIKNGKEKIIQIKTFYPIFENRIVTHKELEVWKMISDGFSSRAIAEKMKITLNTVLTHRKKINKKLKSLKA